MTNEDDGITIDLTNRYDANWMARGRKEMEYRTALQDYMMDEHGYSEDEVEILDKKIGLSALTILEEEWDDIWNKELEPADALLDHVGEETVIAVLEDDFETHNRNRLEQKMEYRPHMQDLYDEIYGDLE